MRALLIACFLTLAPICVPGAALAQVPADLAREAHEYERAQIEGDRVSLERLIADDYVLVSGDGSRTDKAGHIAEFTAPEMDLQPVTVRDAVEHVWTDGAALGGTVDVVGTFAESPFRQTLRYVDVWALRNGHWRVVYGQATRVPAAN